jgi:hypothetical protein
MKLKMNYGERIAAKIIADSEPAYISLASPQFSRRG